MECANKPMAVIFDTQFLENVLTTYSDYLSLSVISFGPLGELSNDSPVYQVQHVNFLHKWISNEAYHDLETMSTVIENVIDGDMVRQAIEFEDYDLDEPEKRPTEVVIDMP
ncbi:hypothetical protein L5515_006124 [Caenorhabditis briggsae]|uniref:Uncharacterized protein n=1 Tax=Caenorhabditis briggsae TaxID=6238 RepID=A0AAE9EZT6_CAEBR|nr:hypothetical protein L5515_006124 [Caenorhabditis briggsae]